MKQTLLTLLSAVFVATGYASASELTSASELNGTLLACGDNVKRASIQSASVGEETTQIDSTTSPEQTSNDQADSADEGSASGEPMARAEDSGEGAQVGERAQVDDEALW